MAGHATESEMEIGNRLEWFLLFGFVAWHAVGRDKVARTVVVMG